MHLSVCVLVVQAPTITVLASAPHAAHSVYRGTAVASPLTSEDKHELAVLLRDEFNNSVGDLGALQTYSDNSVLTVFPVTGTTIEAAWALGARFHHRVWLPAD